MEIKWCDIRKYHPNNIIDLRDKYLFNKKHMAGTRNIYYAHLLINPEEYLNREEEYVLICEYGIKSKMVSNILNKK